MKSSLVGKIDCSRVRDLCREYRWCSTLLPIIGYLQGFDEAHGLPHTVRVLCNVYNILAETSEKLEKERLEDLVIATLLHDIGRGIEEEAEQHHAVISAQLASRILQLLGFSEERIDRIKTIILEHSYSLGNRPSSLESCILSDADKLDALGAIGVYRMSVVGYEASKPLLNIASHYYEKLEKLPSMMCLEVSKKKGREKLAVLKKFVEELIKDSLEYEEAVIHIIDKAVI